MPSIFQTYQINKEVLSIDSSKNLSLKTLDNEYFISHGYPATDNGTNLDIYSNGNEIVKIVDTVGLSFGMTEYTYYFSNGKLIFVSLKESDYPVNEEDSSRDYSKLNSVFEGKFYFVDEKLVKVEKSGTRNMNYQPNDETEQYLLKSAKNDMELAKEKDGNSRSDGLIQNINTTDKEVFSDGSIPSPWDVAGFNHPEDFKKFLLNLRELVIARNKSEVIKVLDKDKFPKQYATTHYDELFNQKVIDAFTNMNVNEIFRNYQGAMIGNGTVWFWENKDSTFTIIAINNK